MKTQFQKRLGLHRLMKRCSCGRTATIRTSWTDDNPGRRFYSCLFKPSNYPFIGWVDPLMCLRSIRIIPGLLRKINNLQAKLFVREQEIRKKKRVIWLLILALVIGSLLVSIVCCD
ncbi:putative transcription factor GRF family [Helianthus annuus]|uniref:Transcription factor GRF family n=1 Tax=Helianthus annuus TaxID=4232 RepID=A0A9K3HTV5_HELAN|nr:putative transcription factor GRF family [Helianthus annuus]KAJ0503565.1 putative transcription factor GRF family [Helianthus annuus]KAJ0511908.1 putative transcription factor GRF family [Helianthus annuus]KAJ0519578.1 putative transcription factor GRF family [Helianthus annuus]KAJ0877479.1 putative transcription factor GRF family [Helianthus annuus]